MSAGFPQAAEVLRREAPAIAADALGSALAVDATMRDRFDEIGLRRLLHDAETLVGRLAMCVASDDPRWLVEFAEWTGPIFRRRRVSLLDVAVLCEGIRAAAAAAMNRDAQPGADRAIAAADRAIAAAAELLRRNARLAGDPHKRSALWRWMYRGV
jgi:hypothetical protein